MIHRLKHFEVVDEVNACLLHDWVTDIATRHLHGHHFCWLLSRPAFFDQVFSYYLEIHFLLQLISLCVIE